MQISQRIHPNRLLRLGTLLGLVLILIAVIWKQLIGQENPIAEWYPAQDQLAEILLGSGLGLAGAVAAVLMTALFPAVRRMRDMLIEMMVVEELTLWHALAFGFLAGIPEEIFFRGALQSVIGLYLTAIIFAGFHAITPLYFLYTLMAGLALGGLADWRDNLWAATAAHIIYDAALFAVFRWHSPRKHTMIGD
jgi:uncharacterized protein